LFVRSHFFYFFLFFPSHFAKSTSPLLSSPLVTEKEPISSGHQLAVGKPGYK
jgi:hypothetical protein